ncbi:HPP family protein [Aquabacter sp. P-9]|uniref:HPP family protein n=1 Tax=Aquabacter sediminis TaxID=3029197 RepID=UPI00237E5704|nr:HPP family protein [Aquabacter sp. P-9]MDE1566907.1 HPP family protein [Aquabacter sp. P-9]
MTSDPHQSPDAAHPALAVLDRPQDGAAGQGDGTAPPLRRQVLLWGWRALGAALAVGAMELAADLGETPISLIPFATSIAVVMGMPDADPAQPRALIGGHVISSLIGLAVLWLAGPSYPAAAAAVGIAFFAMQATRTLHPPAGIDPIIIVLEQLSPTFLLVPVATGCALLVAYTYVWHTLAGGPAWPRRWL